VNNGHEEDLVEELYSLKPTENQRGVAMSIGESILCSHPLDDIKGVLHLHPELLPIDSYFLSPTSNSS